MKKVLVILIALSGLTAAGRERAPGDNAPASPNLGGKAMAKCAVPKSSKELWFNNVRTIIYTGGDMWWDLNGNSQAYYYIPAVQNRNQGISSSFAGSIWLGGLDAGGQLKIAAMTYRQHGYDFWPGPLDTTNASADPAQCARYDQIYSMSRGEVEKFVETQSITPSILNWPGNGDVSIHQGRRLAPFVDVDNDGFYDPNVGDYPAYDIFNKAEKDQLGFCKAKLYGDNTLFWVFNDNGDIHTETQGIPIGVEVRAQAFAFKTSDEINNMTFYSYEVFNRSSFQLNQTYFTIWNDADLGYYLDDYVGCDVQRGLGYIYNADPYDESVSGTNGYLDFPPALGCDFFKGPLADRNDNLDNDQDGVVDELGETIQMSRFTYYNNNIGAFPPQTVNPDIAIHFYNYMIGKWKDGSFFTEGGNAYGGTVPSRFVYNGNPVNNTGWTERGSGNLPGDRRFLQSAGPFTLKPGAVNEITFGMPWAQSPNKGGNLQSLELLYSADDKAQALFDNCFKLLDGPEAPVMTIQEMPNELVFYLTNEKGKNNYKRFNNDYAEDDVTIVDNPGSPIPALRTPDKTYRFEGYIVYQVVSDAVTANDLSDPTKAKIVFQCDVDNGIGKIQNFEFDNLVGRYVAKTKVEGADNGIQNTFRITEDAFSTVENRKLVNNKQYHYICVAYAYNNFLTYVPDVAPSTDPNANFLGQKRAYLEGRRFKKATGTPHPIDFEHGGTIAQAKYGFGPKITRIQGQGNGGNYLKLTAASENAIVTSTFVPNITYENGQGPLSISVVDPLNVKNSEFRFRFINYKVANTAPTVTANLMRPSAASTAATTFTGTAGALNVDQTSWELKDLTTGQLYYPNEVRSAADTDYQPIRVGSQFYFPDLGFAVTVRQVPDPGEMGLNRFSDNPSVLTGDSMSSNAFLGASITYENGTSNWLNSLRDQDVEAPFNWIHSGSSKTAGSEDAYYRRAGTDKKISAFYDPNKQFGKILEGTWAPYPLVSSYYVVTPSGSGNPARIFCGPGFSGNAWAQDEYYAKIAGAYPPTSSAPDVGNTDLRRIGSVLVVMTRDKSKWSRSVVLEMQEKSALSQGNALFFAPRKHLSVDKNGNVGDSIVGNSEDDADFISATGMGWFPGYAISLETGERLNIAFGEDSYQRENNGDDMIFNPTSSYNTPYSFAFGGKHFVYVFGASSISGAFPANSDTTEKFVWEKAGIVGLPYGFGRYDGCKRLINVMSRFFSPSVLKSPGDLGSSGIAPINAIERDIAWVSVPMPAPGYGFKNPADMPSDVRIQINVSKPYRYGWAGVSTNNAQSVTNINKLGPVNNPSLVTGFVDDNPSSAHYNNNFPVYTFNTSDIATLYDQNDIAKAALDQIRVVPNPYYGASTYENNRTSNVVRIINLPNKCTMKIFSMNGTLIRTINRDVTGQEGQYELVGESKRAKRTNFIEWDMKNQNNISVSSGLYIFHIDAPGLGEKIVKWFGIMRPLDVQSY